MSDVLHKNRLEEAYELLKDADPRWVNTILRMTRMAAGKGKDYGNDEDNLANLTACKSMGIEPWVGVTIRMRDKEQRIDSFLTTGELENESLEDAIWDSAVYSAHRATLYEEGCGSAQDSAGVPPTPWDDADFDDEGSLLGCLWDHISTTHPFYSYWGERTPGGLASYKREAFDRLWRDWHEAGCP